MVWQDARRVDGVERARKTGRVECNREMERRWSTEVDIRKEDGVVRNVKREVLSDMESKEKDKMIKCSCEDAKRQDV